MNELDKTVDKLCRLLRECLVTRDYQFISCDKHIATIRVEGKYDFMLWIANGVEHLRVHINHNEVYDKMYNGVFSGHTQDRNISWKGLQVNINKYYITVMKKKKLIELSSIQRELKDIGELENTDGN